MLYVLEEHMKKGIPQHEISQGMFRALALIVFIEYLSTKDVSTLIVDDLCEGLDYNRASKLGKLLFSKIELDKVQLITTSNDSFLMDLVNIEYWNVLLREGAKVKAFNYTNSKDLFDEFRYTGLSNFDLFSSDYLQESQK